MASPVTPSACFEPLEYRPTIEGHMDLVSYTQVASAPYSVPGLLPLPPSRRYITCSEERLRCQSNCGTNLTRSRCCNFMTFGQKRSLFTRTGQDCYEKRPTWKLLDQRSYFSLQKTPSFLFGIFVRCLLERFSTPSEDATRVVSSARTSGNCAGGVKPSQGFESYPSRCVVDEPSRSSLPREPVAGLSTCACRVRGSFCAAGWSPV
jgi:hypothetical protein